MDLIFYIRTFLIALIPGLIFKLVFPDYISLIGWILGEIVGLVIMYLATR